VIGLKIYQKKEKGKNTKRNKGHPRTKRFVVGSGAKKMLSPDCTPAAKIN